MKLPFLSALLLTALPNLVKSDNEIVSVHGSGTTNPSKFFWLLMGVLEDRVRTPTRISYRAVGSSTGIAEFLGVNNTGINAFKPYNDFGSGDIPVPSESWQALKDAGQEMYHLPFALGAISIFHSIPNVPSGKGGLNMTSCLLARVFKRDIITWDHPDILELNPNLSDLLPRKSYPIKVGHRVKGSSSTASVTSYLNVGCPEEWGEDLVGSTITWPVDDNVFPSEGSGGMTTTLREYEGTIGYLDAGHGHAEGLSEIELKNADGKYLSSKEAADNGGIASAADQTDLPDTFDQDFGAINYLNKGGEFTWPIVAMTYVFVRKDLTTFMDSPIEQGLLIAFLKTLYDPDIFEDLAVQFGFTAAPESVSRKALAAINSIKLSDGAPEWTFETSTDPGAGQGAYVISVKRRASAEYQIAVLQTHIDNMKANLAATTEDVRTLSNSKNSEGFGSKESTQLTVSLALSIISIVLWVVTAIALFARSRGGSSIDHTYANGSATQNGNGVQHGSVDA